MNIFLVDLITVAVLNVTVFSLQIFLPPSLEGLSHYISLQANMMEVTAPQISLSLSFKCFVNLRSFIVKQCVLIL